MRPPTAPANSYQQAQTIPTGQAPTYRPVETYTTAELKGDPIQPGKSYRLQVGSYRVPGNATEAMDRLTRMGINAQYEPYGGMYRVVVSNVSSEDVPSMAIKIGNAGFREAVARTEH
jgi:cell division protein FtsN